MGRNFWFEDWWPVELLCLIGLVVLTLAVIGLLRSRARRTRSRAGAMRRRLKTLGFSALAVLGLLTMIGAALFLFQFGSYHTLSEWEVVARVRCSPRGSLGQFNLRYTTLARGKERASRNFEFYGDRWALRADFVEWKGFVRRLGIQRSFKITRLSGVYERQSDYLERPVTDLTLGRGSDRVWLRARKGHFSWPLRHFIRGVYTSVVSSSPAPDELFDIVGTKDGLAARKVTY
jgi:hypothetical protein